MRISDWSSDVCSSDLGQACLEANEDTAVLPPAREQSILHGIAIVDAHRGIGVGQLGDRMGGRLGVGDSVSHPGDSISIKHGRLHGRRKRNSRSEEHTSELQSLMRISYAVLCLKKKKQN